MIRSILITIIALSALLLFRPQLFAQSKDTAGLSQYITDNVVNKNPTQVSSADSLALAQSIARVNDDNTRNAIDKYNKDRYMKSPEFITCIVILFFATLVCIAEVFLFLKGKINSSQIIKLLIITLIIFAVLFLIASGYSNDQISPAVGLLGTIAGYLLGKSTSEPESTTSTYTVRETNKPQPNE